MVPDNAWQVNAATLANYTWQHYAIKRDRHGIYSATGGANWSFSELTEQDLRNHFEGSVTLGLGTTDTDDRCLWCAWDLDNHSIDETTNANLEYALNLRERLANLGAAALVEHSDGRGGVHVWVRFAEPVPAAAAHRFARWIAEDYEQHVEAIECFPKQPTVQHTEARCGNYLRLPGKHHKRDHWSVFFGDSDWLSIAESVDQWIQTPPADSAILKHAPPEPERPPVAAVPSFDHSDDREQQRLQDALNCIPADAYDTWVQVGQCLHSEGDAMLPVWDSWSAASEKYQPGECARKWKSFHRSGSGVGLGTLFETAKRFGWVSRGNETARTDETEESPDEKPKPKLAAEEFQPFPLDTFPDALSEFIRQAAASIGVDTAFIVLPMLSVCAAAIGRSRQMMVKPGWFVPSILWTVVIGESGCGKSPAFRLAVEPMKRRQKKLSEQYAAERAEYESDLRQYKRDLKNWERNPDGGEPAKPEVPAHLQVVVKDTTVEGLAIVLNQHQRGVLMARDELSGWFASFDRYAGKAATSGDVTSWLEFYNCEHVMVNRKSADCRYLFIEDPSVSVCGGVQPGTLARCLTSEHKDNGLQSRLMLAYPPRQQKRWRDDSLPPTASDGYADIIDQLFDLKPDTDIEGNSRPALLRLSDDALSAMANFVNRNGREQNAMTGHAASQWSKLEELPARIGIVLHCLKQVIAGVADPWTVDRDTIQAAITIAEWFKAEAMRVNRLLTEDEETRNARQLADWIRSRGGEVTAAELSRCRRDIRSSEQAELLLIDLANRGAGEWQDIHRSRKFVLA